MADANKAIDISDCIQKEADYYRKARAATDPGIKAAYESTAREYGDRAKRLREEGLP